MPKLDKGITLTWAKKNFDVRDILIEEKLKGTVLTDFICNAIRFYENNKYSQNNKLNELILEEIIDKKIRKALKNYNNEISITEKENKINNLEYLENLEDINDKDLEDD